MHQRVSLFGVEIDALSMSEAIDHISGWLDGLDEACHFVVTPNVDHIVMLQKHDQLKAAYQDASLALADGFPIVMAARLLGKRLPQRVAGSELIPALFDRLESRGKPTRVYLLGAMPGIAIKAARVIDKTWPQIKIVGTYSPPLGFEENDEECKAILENLRESNTDVVIFGVGAPKQELWAHRFHDRIPAKVILCVGATIDFLAGEKSQAPVWMRRSGLEWVHRCASEPRRLAGRYAKDAVIFPQILLREFFRKRSHS